MENIICYNRWGTIGTTSSISPTGQEDLKLVAGNNIKISLDNTEDDQKVKFELISQPTISTIINTGTLTLPTTTDTLVGRDTTDTLTNKTLTNPDINGADIDGATIDTSNITVGTGKTLDLRGGTFTLDDGQINGSKITNTSIDLTQKVSGVLPIANGGTGANTLNNLITLGHIQQEIMSLQLLIQVVAILQLIIQDLKQPQ